MLPIPKDQNTLTIKVTPRSNKIEFVGMMDDWTLKIRLRAIPEDGSANQELLEYLERETGEVWEIVSGWTGERKTVRKL